MINKLKLLAVGLLLALALFAGCGRTTAADQQPTSTFTIVALPDTQFYSESYPEIFTAQTKWIVDNIEKEHIAFVTHEGDIVDICELKYQWVNALKAMDLLHGKVPYGTCPGNHDMIKSDGDKKYAIYVSHFGPERFKAPDSVAAWYGGASENGANSWQQFTAGGRTYLAISLEYNVPETAQTWAQKVIKDHPGLPTIITTHAWLDVHGNRLEQPDGAFKPLIAANPQVFLVLCGHKHGASRRVDKNDAGQDIIQILADYQEDEKGGNGFMRLMTFDESANKIHVRSYSPTVNKFHTDDANQFDVALNFSERFKPPEKK